MITKNNFGMPMISNKKFIPVNKTEAKSSIFRNIQHDHQLDDLVKLRQDLYQTTNEQG